MAISISKFDAAAKRIKPVSEDKVIQVTFKLEDSLFDDYIEQLVQVVELNMEPTLVISHEEVVNTLTTYLRVLLRCRMDYVNGIHMPFKPQDPQFTVPAFFSVILEQIGRVDASRHYGLILMPEKPQENYWDEAFKRIPPTKEEENEVVTRQNWLRELSRKVRRWFNYAEIEYADCMPRAKTGTLDLMTLQILEQTVLAPHADVNPVFALMGAVVGVHQAMGVFVHNPMSYGRFAAFRESVAQACNLEAKRNGNN